MKNIIIFILFIFLTACNSNDNKKNIEASIKAEVAAKLAGIAPLPGIYVVFSVNSQHHLPMERQWFNECIRESRGNINYEFKIEDDDISITEKDLKKILHVKLHKGNAYKDQISPDAELESTVRRILSKNKDRNLKFAEDNLRSFFNIIAVKYGLELDFSIET